MKNLKFLLMMLVAMSVAVSSCKKDDDDDNNDDNNNNTPQTCYLNKINYGDYYSLAEYNTNHLITKMTDYDSNGVADGYYTTISYDANGKIQNMTSYDGSTIDFKMVFIYGSGTHPDSVAMYSDDGNGNLERDGSYILTFTGDKLTKVEVPYTIMGNTIIISKTEYTYTGENLTMESEYEFDLTTLQMELTSSYEYEHDAKKNPYYGIGLNYFVFLDGMFGSENNVTKETYKDDAGTVDQEYSYNYTYEYNSSNYPTKSTSTSFDNSDTYVEMYEYDCQ
jgi:hypothetical protein